MLNVKINPRARSAANDRRGILRSRGGLQRGVVKTSKSAGLSYGFSNRVTSGVYRYGNNCGALYDDRVHVRKLLGNQLVQGSYASVARLRRVLRTLHNSTAWSLG